jgi:hypothetical protein
MYSEDSATIPRITRPQLSFCNIFCARFSDNFSASRNFDPGNAFSERDKLYRYLIKFQSKLDKVYHNLSVSGETDSQKAPRKKPIFAPVKQKGDKTCDLPQSL